MNTKNSYQYLNRILLILTLLMPSNCCRPVDVLRFGFLFEDRTRTLFNYHSYTSNVFKPLQTMLMFLGLEGFLKKLVFSCSKPLKSSVPEPFFNIILGLLMLLNQCIQDDVLRFGFLFEDRTRTLFIIILGLLMLFKPL